MDENTTIEQTEQTAHDDAKTEEKKTETEYKPTIESPFTPDELKIIIGICKTICNGERRKFISKDSLIDKLYDEKNDDIVKKVHKVKNIKDLSYFINTSNKSASDEEKNKIKADIEAKRTELNALKEKLSDMEKPPVYAVTK